MNSKNWKGKLVATTVISMIATVAMAQAQDGRPGDPRRQLNAGGGDDRSAVLQQMKIEKAALGLSATQSAQIDKMIDAFLSEQKALQEKYPATRESTANPDAHKARMASRAKLNTGIGRILSADQRKVWEASLTERRQGGRPLPGR